MTGGGVIGLADVPDERLRRREEEDEVELEVRRRTRECNRTRDFWLQHPGEGRLIHFGEARVFEHHGRVNDAMEMTQVLAGNLHGARHCRLIVNRCLQVDHVATGTLPPR